MSIRPALSAEKPKSTIRRTATGTTRVATAAVTSATPASATWPG